MSRPRGGHPFRAGQQHRGAKPRTAKVRQAARRTVQKAQSARYRARFRR